MTELVAVDTSVAVPLVMQTHREHAAVRRWRGSRSLALSGHALAETYSVLTRLPDDSRLESDDAARLMAEGFAPPLLLGRRAAQRLPEVLSRLSISGGAVYDALVALAAKEHGCALATRDGRAKATYDTVGVELIVVGWRAGS
ncbi:MAG TPA: type II toxin-antitoxin system VapC family toxin [Jatrophihabitantaceae bacterium]